MKAKLINRRHFIKMSSSAAAALGLSQFLFTKEVFAAGPNAKKPAVIWLEAQDCTGCTESVLSSLTPAPIDVLLDTINLQYHETVMSGTGYVAESALQAAIQEGGYILVIEGAIPAADKRFMKVAGKPVEDTFIEASRNASAIIAIGACASYGGICRGGESDGQGAEYFLDKHGVSKTLINLPGCPLHPQWFYETVIDFLNGKNINLDSNKRPTSIYGQKVHRNCFRRGTNLCLKSQGCKGMWTKSNCPTLKWNDGVNWCIGSGAPCAGCTEPAFYDQISPLYTKKFISSYYPK